ncbi:ribonucleotide reductase [Mycena metata]|uniref:Ribonucleotide reductase n=1 Tax=Mycena metata TaxID=1033252 RepID=A0AAD7KD40_9AGAR|nr:ribonucleotide reductase [Mycena metata]
MHKTILPKFTDAVKTFRDVNGNSTLTADFMEAVEKYQTTLNSAIVHLRDYDHTYGTISDMQHRMLNRHNGRITERIQHLYMRIAVAIHLQDIASVLNTYELLSTRHITLDAFISAGTGTTGPMISTSYSIALFNSHIHDMYDAIARTVFAVRRGGTASIAAQKMPCSGRNVHCQHKDCNIGLWTLMKFLDGAIAFTRHHEDLRTDIVNIAVEAWHLDVRALIDFNNMHQHELADHKSLTTTICIPDIFMNRVDENEEWSMFCPSHVDDLFNLSGPYFDQAYRRHESGTTPCIKIQARELWHAILRSIILTGGPSIIFKDNVNGKSNFADTSPACHSDLRTGMIDPLAEEDELYPRNHTSIALPLFVTRDGLFDFEKLHEITKEAVYLLNKALDASMPQLLVRLDRNRDFRSIGVGIHGLADVFVAMRMPYESLEAAELNVQIAETMYHAALEGSWELAMIHGPYTNFPESPLANGILQFDFWDAKPMDRYDWPGLRDRIRATGVRNATLISIGPGSGGYLSSGFTDTTEPLPSNVLEGEIICPWLVEDLSILGIWDDDIRANIVSAKGSIQHIATVPANIKAIYRTAWEIDPKSTLKMALGRAPFVCNSQSISFHLDSPNIETLGDLLMRAWSSGLKSGLHSVHSRFPEHRASVSSYEDADDSDREMSFDDVVVSSNSP